MKVTFRNQRDEIFYQTEKSLVAAYSPRMGRKISRRIRELEAAANPQQLPPNARFHEHQGNRKGLFSIDLVDPFRLIVRPTCVYRSFIEITSIEIYEVFNPH